MVAKPFLTHSQVLFFFFPAHTLKIFPSDFHLFTGVREIRQHYVKEKLLYSWGFQLVLHHLEQGFEWIINVDIKRGGEIPRKF